MIGLLLLMASALQVAPAAQRETPIIVTAQRLPDLKAALDACLARKCPPNEDIDATLGLAEKQFLDGDYEGARRTAASVGRNNRHAAAHPVAVADLQRSCGRIGAHLGEPNIYRFATNAAVRAHKSGLDRNDGRVIAAQLEAGNMQARTGEIDGARRTYRRAADRAREHGFPMLVGTALVRLVLLGGSESRQSAEARQALAELSADPALARFALAIKLVAARRAAQSGDGDAIDRLVAELPRNNGARPMLVYAPRLNLNANPSRLNDAGGSVNVDGEVQLDPVVNQWMDVGFWVTPEGRVGDIEVLRASPRLTGDWPKRVTAAIAGRRYTPVASPLGDPGTFRVERHTFTADRVRLTGSRIADRKMNPKVEILDLTNDLPPATS